ncbi:MAG: membrane protein insertion efficiency factor YidD [Janthinobacterium lividum]
MQPAEKPERMGSRERLAQLLFLGYKRVISPLLSGGGMGQCKYLPSCSEYALVAVVRHGWWHGGGLALWRLLRCHPFARGGVDPVP